PLPQKGLSCLNRRPRCVHEVVDEYGGFALYVSAYVHDFRNVRVWPSLVGHRKRRVYHLRIGPGPFHAARVGRYDYYVLFRVFLLYIVYKNGSREYVVDVYFEESLYLPGVNVHRDDPADAGRRDKVSD